MRTRLLISCDPARCVSNLISRLAPNKQLNRILGPSPGRRYSDKPEPTSRRLVHNTVTTSDTTNIKTKTKTGDNLSSWESTSTTKPKLETKPKSTSPPHAHTRRRLFPMDDAAYELADRFEDMAEAASSRGRRRGGRAGRGGRSGGGGGGGVQLSKALSRLLRHQAGNAGIELDREGFARVERVLQWPPIRSLAPTFADIAAAVRDNDKQRFTLKPNPATNPSLDESSTNPSHWLIRANQGHSIKLDSEQLLKPLALPDGTPLPEGSVPVPDTVVHGTYFASWPAIVASGGLRPMGRTHVHFSTGLPEGAAGGVVSGMRRDAELLVYVDVAASMREAGLRWWISDNGVVLTEGDADGLVPARFFREVVGRRRGVGVLWKDGEKVADLPAGLKIHSPQGKHRASGSSRGGRGGQGR